MSLQTGNKVLVHQTAIHHRYHLQHILIGDTTTVNHLVLQAELGGYLRGTAATAMYQYFLTGDGREIFQQLVQLCLVFHDCTAYFYDG